MGKEIIYHGKRYERIEDLPPEARQAFQQLYALSVDEDGNGIPDILEGMPRNMHTVRRISMRSALGNQRMVNLENAPTWLKKLMGMVAKRALEELPPQWTTEGGMETPATDSLRGESREYVRLSQPLPSTPPPFEEISTVRRGVVFMLVVFLLLAAGAILLLPLLT